MTEEEFFIKNYPDSCYGDKPLSPHWDLFQDGVEFGERQSEKKLAELEKENAELRAKLKYAEENCINKTCVVFKDKEDCVAKLLDLERVNTELKCECRRCVYADSPCILSDYGKDKNGICDHFKDVFDENIELKSRECWKSCEYTNPKSELIAQHIKDVQNLTKAKEIIHKVCYEYGIYDKKLMGEAEQFLSEVEK